MPYFFDIIFKVPTSNLLNLWYSIFFLFVISWNNSKIFKAFQQCYVLNVLLFTNNNNLSMSKQKWSEGFLRKLDKQMNSYRQIDYYYLRFSIWTLEIMCIVDKGQWNYYHELKKLTKIWSSILSLQELLKACHDKL